MNLAGIPEGISSRFVMVDGQPMHYLEMGSGRPIVFLHGNPTSSYLWRNVMPHLASHGRCVAVDLIGMGRSGKPSISYGFQDHAVFIDKFIETLGLTDMVLVVHDWGASLGLHYFARFPERIRGVAFMEGRLHPVNSWADFSPEERTMFQQLRSEEVGRKLVFEDNFFIETVLPSGVQRTLTTEEMEAYREPFRNPEDRTPVWRWPQEIPIEGEPVDVHNLVNDYHDALTHSPIPKLLLHAEPGSVIDAAEVARCRDTLSNLTSVHVGNGYHFLPEDHPHTIGAAIADWLDEIGD